MELQLNNICHTYNNKVLSLNDVSVSFDTGITGLLGVNGAGKSSLLNIMGTVAAPTQGSYTADGTDALANPMAIRKRLGFLPQVVGLIPELTPYRFLQYMGLLKGCSPTQLKVDIVNVLNYLNLLSAKDIPIKQLSGGMKQRVGIAQAIINQPSLLIMDEPMVGLDPNERNSFNHLIADIAKTATVVLSSHIIDDIENMCENVVVLEAGMIKYKGPVSSLVHSVSGMVYEDMLSRTELEALSASNSIIRTKPMGEKVLVRYLSPQKTGISAVTPSLEDAFIYKTKYKTA